MRTDRQTDKKKLTDAFAILRKRLTTGVLHIVNNYCKPGFRSGQNAVIMLALRRRLDSPAYGSAQQVGTVNHKAVKKETRIKTEYPSILFHKNRKLTTGHTKPHTVYH